MGEIVFLFGLFFGLFCGLGINRVEKARLHHFEREATRWRNKAHKYAQAYAQELDRRAR